MMGAIDDIISAIREGDLSTRDLVLISCALAARGSHTTSVLGQYGEELVAAAYDRSLSPFAQKGYDVVTSSGDHLQVKTYTRGRRPGVIRSFVYDVITLEVNPATANVVKARRYSADELFAAFRFKVGDEVPAH